MKIFWRFLLHSVGKIYIHQNIKVRLIYDKLFRCNFGLSQGTIQNETPKSCFLQIFWHLRQSDKNLRNRMQFLKKVYLDNIVRLQKTPKIVMYGLYFLRKGWLHADRYRGATDLGSTQTYTQAICFSVSVG